MESLLSQQLVNSKGVMEEVWSPPSVHEEGVGSTVAPQIGLSLELGRGSEPGNQKALVCHRFSGGFTLVQLQELQLQALIFKYISAGLPVPNHLLLPIWQSFSNSLSSYPASLGIIPMCLDSRKGIEQEPWRCRRTDGKKWRCGKEALPHHKYCERHIHRGRHRSRKLVASSSSSSSSSQNRMTSTTSFGSNGIAEHAVIGSTMTELSISLPQNDSSSSTLYPSFGFDSKDM